MSRRQLGQPGCERSPRPTLTYEADALRDLMLINGVTQTIF
jgi:hypothetical protein